jgi:hypothetical protein
MGCAGNIRGTLTQTLLDGTTPAPSNWSWTGLLGPKQDGSADECCAGIAGTLSVQLSWDNVTCP